MDVARLFFGAHDELRVEVARLAELPDDHWRARPHGMNSVAWLVWHMVRAEDCVVNRLVFDRPQVLDDPATRWPERMRVPLRHHGSTMTSAEVDRLTADVDVAALVAYAAAAGARTHELVEGMRPEMLDEVVEPERLRRVLIDEGLLRAAQTWREPLPYSGGTRGALLLDLGVIHPTGHFYDIQVVRGVLRAGDEAGHVQHPGSRS